MSAAHSTSSCTVVVELPSRSTSLQDTHCISRISSTWIRSVEHHAEACFLKRTLIPSYQEHLSFKEPQWNFPLDNVDFIPSPSPEFFLRAILFSTSRLYLKLSIEWKNARFYKRYFNAILRGNVVSTGVTRAKGWFSTETVRNRPIIVNVVEPSIVTQSTYRSLLGGFFFLRRNGITTGENCILAGKSRRRGDTACIALSGFSLLFYVSFSQQSCSLFSGDRFSSAIYCFDCTLRFRHIHTTITHPPNVTRAPSAASPSRDGRCFSSYLRQNRIHGSLPTFVPLERLTFPTKNWKQRRRWLFSSWILLASKRPVECFSALTSFQDSW